MTAAMATTTAVLALGACGGGNENGSAPSAPSGGAASTAPSAARTGSAAALKHAGATAEKRVDGGTLVSIERESGGAVWETQVVAPDGKEHELDVAASGGTVRSAHVKKESAAKRAEHRKRVAAAKVGYATAADTMSGAVPGGSVTELNLDDRRGTTVWEGDVRTGGAKHEVKLDAASGAVLVNRTAPAGD